MNNQERREKYLKIKFYDGQPGKGQKGGGVKGSFAFIQALSPNIPPFSL